MKNPCLSLTMFVWMCLGLSPVQAISIPEQGAVLNHGAVVTATLNQQTGHSEPLPGGGQRITITHPDPGKTYLAQFTAKCGGSISKGEVVLAVIRARTVGGIHQGVMLAKLQVDEAPYTPLASTTEISVPHEWTDLPVTFVSELDGTIPNTVLQLLCAHKEQTLDVASVHLYRYAAGTSLKAFPKIKRTYPGREVDAPWRKAALERIEQHRKADLSLTLRGADGTPLREAEVRVDLQRHHFGFGSAVTAKLLTDTGPDAERYREIVDRYFSVVVFENDLKDGQWNPALSPEQKKLRNDLLDRSFAWLQQRHIAVRGHYLMQIPTPYNFHDEKDNQRIRQWVLESVRERLDFVRDRVVEWDVINHPIAWASADMLNKRAGLEALDEEAYQVARGMTQLPFFVNEDQVFRPGPQHDDTYRYIEALQKKGLSIQGLGNQAHFSDSYLPSPEHLLAVTDHFAKIVPHQSITEFDVLTHQDEELAADFTRDVLIAVFSHPAYTSFLFWGFWEGSHWIPDAASWNKDWSVRARGAVIEEWIGKRWHTQLTLKTDDQGRIQWRGFPGWYHVHLPGQEEPLSVPLTKEEPAGKLTY